MVVVTAFSGSDKPQPVGIDSTKRGEPDSDSGQLVTGEGGEGAGLEQERGPGHLGSGLPSQETVGARDRGLPSSKGYGLPWGGRARGLLIMTGWVWGPLSPGPCRPPQTHLLQRARFCSARPLPGDPVARRPGAASATQLLHTRRPPRRCEHPQARAGSKVGMVIFYRVTVGNKGGSALFVVQKGSVCVRLSLYWALGTLLILRVNL